MMEHYEKKLSSELLYDGKILRLHRDLVELENGNRTYREVIDHPGGVSVLAVDEQDQILFVRQFRYPFSAQLLELPAGKLERGEDPAACGQRELEEECGCIAGIYQPLGKLYPTCAYDTEIIYLFFATDLKFTKQHLDADEFLTVERIPIQKAVEMVLAGEIPDAKTQIAILRYWAQRQTAQNEG